jgi:hypothetical protein
MRTFHNKTSCIYFISETPTYVLSFASQPEIEGFTVVAEINDTIKENGHSALHLLPYHPSLNHIKLVWGDIKIVQHKNA